MRDVFRTTATQAAADGTLKGLAGIEVTVYLAGTATPVPIYQRGSESLAGTGPSPESGATGVSTSGVPNGLLTVAGGAIEFWVPIGCYDIHMRDTQIPARILTRGYGSPQPAIQFNSMPASAGTLPTSLLAADAGLLLTHLAPAVLRQVLPIGQVIDWWRPSAGVSVPTGFEICDGRTILAANHDFGTGVDIVLPDLRNKFIIGADVYKSDGTASSNGDSTAAAGPTTHPNAPGIRGVGGSNATRDLTHQHTIPGHKHTVSDPGHDHGSVTGYSGTGISTGGAGSHTHDLSNFHTDAKTSGGYWGDQWSIGSGTLTYRAGNWANDVATGKAYGVGDHTHGISDPSHRHSISSSGTGITVGASGSPDGNNAMATTGLSGNIGSGVLDMRPQHVGLLKLMKVRRA